MDGIVRTWDIILVKDRNFRVIKWYFSTPQSISHNKDLGVNPMAHRPWKNCKASFDIRKCESEFKITCFDIHRFDDRDLETIPVSKELQWKNNFVAYPNVLRGLSLKHLSEINFYLHFHNYCGFIIKTTLIFLCFWDSVSS